MPRSPDLLFVYGTLRPALAVGRPADLVRGLEVVGPATVSGTLYDLGDYPGMVAGPGLVHGDLLRIADAERLAAIDAYEGCTGRPPLFGRELVQARLADGGARAAWAYLWRRPVERARAIRGGDYASHTTRR